MGLANRIKTATPALPSQSTSNSSPTNPPPPAYTDDPVQASGQQTRYSQDRYGEHLQQAPVPVKQEVYQQPYQQPYQQSSQPVCASSVPSTPQHSPTYGNAGSSALESKLRLIISSNRLEGFYDSSNFTRVLNKILAIDFNRIAREWQIPVELAHDLAPLALYDIVFYVDDSGSMAFEENGERIDDLKFILSKVSDLATLFDDDGVTVAFMNSSLTGTGIRSSADVANLVGKVSFSGMTPLGRELDRKVVQPLILSPARGNALQKPVLVIAITDGEPSGEPRSAILDVVKRAKEALLRTRYGPGAFALQIGQVGKDVKTQRFLSSLDNDPTIGSMIDCTSYYEMEAEEFAAKGVILTPELWLLKLCIGAIDPTVDDQD